MSAQRYAVAPLVARASMCHSIPLRRLLKLLGASAGAARPAPIRRGLGKAQPEVSAVMGEAEAPIDQRQEDLRPVPSRCGRHAAELVGGPVVGSQ